MKVVARVSEIFEVTRMVEVNEERESLRKRR